MPNNGRITLCPFYKSEQNLSISCEDVFHRFRWAKQKNRHMDIYCDKDWKACEYAKELLKVYEKGGDMETNTLQHQVDALKKELRKTATMLGKSEKREKEKDEQIRGLRASQRALEQIHMRDRKMLDESATKQKALQEELLSIAHYYEARFAYLIDSLENKFLDEIAFLKWAKENEFKIIPQERKEHEGREITSGWRVEVRRIVEDGNRDNGLAAKDESTGRGKNRGTDEEKGRE